MMISIFTLANLFAQENDDLNDSIFSQKIKSVLFSIANIDTLKDYNQIDSLQRYLRNNVYFEKKEILHFKKENIKKNISKDENHRDALFMVFKEFFFNKPSATLLPGKLLKKENYWIVKALSSYFDDEEKAIVDGFLNICFTENRAWICGE
jgi:hypothetical protein